MGNIQPKTLTRLGYVDNMARSIAMATIAKYCKHDKQEQIISTLEVIIQHPEREKFDDGTAVIIHRKGATPAHAGELGIIPGSMATPGYIVSGKGCRESLFSASHGAGRTMSRLDARNSISRHALKKQLAACDVTLIGGTTEEAPMAYKDIKSVMEAQKELVNIEGTIIPKIVRMSEE